jgi:hypothetical protein
MCIFLRIIIMIMVFMVKNVFAEIREIDKLVELIDCIEKEESLDTLVIFDIDYVLIIPEDAFSMNRNPQRKKIWTEMKKVTSKEEMKLLHSIVTVSARWKLVDQDAIFLFQHLQKKKLKTIGLTSLGTGKLGIIENREDLRYKEIKSVGIDFLKLNCFEDQISLDDLKTEDGIPMLKYGIIFTAEQNKALILEHILNHKKYYPKRIIFIDDMLNNLLSVEDMCKKKNIDFIGFHYIAVSKMKMPKTEEWKEKKRLKILQESKKWLDDSEL